MNKLLAVAILFLATTAPLALSQEPDSELLAGWVALDAPTGHEHHATQPLLESLEGWSRDRMGNLIKTVGAGSGLNVVACFLDAAAFTVSQITDDGYLRLHHLGREPGHALWSQAHEGQQLRILTQRGPVLGVTALANGHFMNLHRHETALTRADDLWLDVGASSASEVADLGIALLDPVLRHLPPWTVGDWIAGPSAGARAGCAVLVAAAEAGLSGAGRTRYVLSAQSSFSGVGVSAAVAASPEVGNVVLLGPGAGEGAEQGAAGGEGLFNRFVFFDAKQLKVITPVVTEAGALMERIHRQEVSRMAEQLADVLGAPATILKWTAAPTRANAKRDDSQPGSRAADSRGNSLDELAQRLKQLGELYGVSGHEGPVRDAVATALPSWAQGLAQTDDLGNLWVDTGPADEAATVFMAHMDEVGWKITAIASDGTVDLLRQGGALSLAREGQPALLHIDPAEGVDSAVRPDRLRGVFLTRSDPKTRWPEQLQAWFGVDGQELERMGVRIGMPVTGYKEAHRLGEYRFTVRGMDDRVGSAALLHALRELDPAALSQRVIFAWSVQEEGGLYGAAALARRLAAETRRIYSIDTFVSSDTPLESPHFAYALLGSGPVLRSVESSGMVRPGELARNQAVAREAGIAVQLGLTQGGTDGTAFTFYGVPNAGLSWPGRYSHGPAELGDLRDMLGLVDLIKAFALAAP